MIRRHSAIRNVVLKGEANILRLMVRIGYPEDNNSKQEKKTIRLQMKKFGLIFWWRRGKKKKVIIFEFHTNTNDNKR